MNVNHVAGPDSDNFLLHVIDKQRNEKWLVDGGALLSIIPPTTLQRLKGPNDKTLKAANGTTISCYGNVQREITIGDQSFSFDFTIADIQQRILGADFLAHFYLAPNHRDAELLNLKDFTTLPAQHARGQKSMSINFVHQLDDPYYQLLDSYPEIMTPSFTIKNPEHGVRHYIPTDPSAPPVQSRARRLDPEKLAVAKAELEKLVDLGIAYRGKSEWSSPLLVTTKPCGGWRVCGDYRRLNALTTDDRYPVRTLQDFTSELHGKKIFSKIDLMKGYHQIPVHEGDVRKTAVITPFGLFIFPRTPFGLKNAGQDFQRLMDEILGDMPRVYVYIDDILVASETKEQHLEDLDAVFKSLAANGLVLQRSKCLLGQSSLEFLGYHVDDNGISPLPDRVVAIQAATPPTTIKELQRFLGMVGYYRRFIPNAASHLFYLFEALKGPRDKKKTLNWTPECQSSFEATKSALAAATLLFHPRPGAQLALTTDASNTAIGGVLEQRGPKGWEPLAFYSSKLEPNQRMWPPYDRELLAAYKGTRHFKSWVEGRPFTLYTDHQSLVPSIHKKTDPQTLRQTYQLACVSEFTTDIRYVEGKANVVADALSRPNEDPLEVTEVSSVSVSNTNNSGEEATSPTNTDSSTTSSTLNSASSTPSPISIPENPWTTRRAAAEAKRDAAVSDLNCVIASVGDMGIDWVAIARLQPLDPEFRRLREDVRSGLIFKSVDIGQVKLICDFSNGPARPYIPFSARKRIFDVLHGLGHPGVERTRQSVCSKVIWPSIRQDVSKWARECLDCQRSKVTRHVTPPIGDFDVPNRRFEHCNIDIVTLPPSNGFRYLLTAVDRFTRWPVAIPMADISAQSVLDAFAFGWIASFGVPSTITTDRGSQFTSALFQQLIKTWGIKANLTAPYHPEANGLVERFHRRLKEALLALGHESPDQWFWRLPCVLLSIRTTLKPDVGASPADLVYGEGLAVPGEVLPANPATDARLSRQRESALADLRLEVSRLMPTQTSAHRKPLVHLPEDLKTCSHVFVRRGGIQSSLSSPYVGPFRVVSRNDVNFRVSIPGRSHGTIAISRVKPAYISLEDDDDAEPASPPPVGRPPRPPPGPAQPPRRSRRLRQRRPENEGLEAPPPPPPPPPPERSNWFDLDSSPPRHPSSPVRPPVIPNSPTDILWIDDPFEDDPPQQHPPPVTRPQSQAAAAAVPRPRSFSKPTSSHFSFRRRSPGVDFPAIPAPAAAPVDDIGVLEPEVNVGPPIAPPKRARIHYLSKPGPSHFSRRRKPDVSIILQHLGLDNSLTDLSTHPPRRPCDSNCESD